jgi:ABC-type glycerol-3-phosphate transport system permease component
MKYINKKSMFYFINIILVVLFLFPVAWTVSTSLKLPENILTYPPKFIPETITFDNYINLFVTGDGVFFKYLLNTVFVTAITIFLVIFISSLAGYVFSNLRFKGLNIFFVLILATMMVPFQSLLIPIYNLLQKVGLLNTYWGLILIYTTFALPFTVFMMKNSFEIIPKSLRESALLDGCSEIQVFFKIYLPLSWPGLATIAVYTFMRVWNEFLVALIFTSDETVQTLQVGLTNFALSRYRTSWEMITSGSIVSVIPIVIFFIFLQRYFIKGLTSGSVKH